MFNRKQKIIILISFICTIAGLFFLPQIVSIFNSGKSKSELNNNKSENNSFYSANSKDAAKQILVVMENIPPYSYMLNDSIMGFDVELSKTIFQKLNLNPVYKVYSWSRCLELIKTKQADAILTIFLTPERENFLYFPDEFCSYEPNAFFLLKGTDIRYSGRLNELSQYTIGVKSSTSYGNQFDNAGFLRRDTSKNQETLIQKIIEKRLEIGIGSIPVISYISKKMNCFDKIEFVKPYVIVDPLYIGFSKKGNNSELVKNFSKELKEFKKSLSYNYLLKKYDITNSAAR